MKGRISDYIPNPTFDRVAAPGAQEEYFKVGNPEGKSRREIMGKAIDAIPAFREPGPRLELMDELGLDRALMWPTLASLVEERLRDDPDATHAVIHALNQWMHEQWTFNYEDRIFPTPVITLPIVDKAIEELEWVIERGAKIILVRPAPVPGFRGPRSFALPEFDPFWELVQEADLVVGMHAVRQRLPALHQRVGRRARRRVHAVQGRRRVRGDHRRSATGRSSTRSPRPSATACARASRGSRSRPSRTAAAGCARSCTTWSRPTSFNPHLFEEDPVEVFKRNIFVHPFHEDDPVGLVGLIGADNVLFGSDYPHPEGMADPLSFVDDLEGLPDEDIAKVMGGNLARLMNIAA